MHKKKCSNIKDEPLDIKSDDDYGSDSSIDEEDELDFSKLTFEFVPDGIPSTSDNIITDIKQEQLLKDEPDYDQSEYIDELYRCDICRQHSPSAHELAAHRYTHTRDNLYNCLICYKTHISKRLLRKHIRKSHALLMRHRRSTHLKGSVQQSLECSICHNRYAHKQTLKKHMQGHVEGKSFECKTCHKRFDSRSLLLVHKHSTHNKVSYECDICHRSYGRKQLLVQHMRTHRPKKYECSICYKRLGQKNHLALHRRTHGVEPYECDICGRTFDNNNRHVRHMRTHARGGKTYDCKVCHKRFTQRINLTKHKRLCRYINLADADAYTCLICNNKYVRKQLLFNHLWRCHSKQSFECDVCHKTFKHRYNMTIHKRTHAHTDKITNECIICHEQFDDTGRHDCTNAGPKLYDCNVCRKVFTQQNNYAKHTRICKYIKTSDVDPFTCLLCTKTYVTKLLLFNHIWRCHNKLSFVCDVCNKTFKHKHNLAAHKQTHSGGKMAYECNICHKQSNNKYVITEHMRTHTGLKPYECSLCHKQFRHRSTIKRHDCSRTGEKTYECEICLKVFTLPRSFLAHKKHIHYGEKQIQCHICNKSYVYRDSYAIHMRTHVEKR